MSEHNPRVSWWAYSCALTEDCQYFDSGRDPPCTLGRRWEVTRVRWEEADRNEQVHLFNQSSEVVSGVAVEGEGCRWCGGEGCR